MPVINQCLNSDIQRSEVAFLHLVLGTPARTVLELNSGTKSKPDDKKLIIISFRSELGHQK